MQVVEGIVGLVGAGTWRDGGGSGGGATLLSVLEIGDHNFKRIVLTDYLGNYLKPGAQVRVLIAKGLSQGVISRPFIAAVEVDGKKYKVETRHLVFVNVVKAAAIGGLFGLIGGALFMPLGLAIAGGVFYYYFKQWKDLAAF